jgi:hypothetical protein
MNGGFAISQGGTALGDFIDAQLAGDAGWADVRP